VSVQLLVSQGIDRPVAGVFHFYADGMQITLFQIPDKQEQGR